MRSDRIYYCSSGQHSHWGAMDAAKQEGGLVKCPTCGEICFWYTESKDEFPVDGFGGTVLWAWSADFIVEGTTADANIALWRRDEHDHWHQVGQVFKDRAKGEIVCGVDEEYNAETGSDWQVLYHARSNYAHTIRAIEILWDKRRVAE